jgi:hypothetical protein
VTLHETATKTLNSICQPFGEHALSKAEVFEWHNKFLKARKDVKDDK